MYAGMRRGFLLSKPKDKGEAPSSSTQEPGVRSSQSQKVPHVTPALQESKPAPDAVPIAHKPVLIPTTLYTPPPELPYTSDHRGRNARIRSLPAYTHPREVSSMVVWYDGMPQEVEALYPNFPHPFSSPRPPVYKVANIDGAGLGVVATADIQAGDTIVCERPLFVYPSVMIADTQEVAEGVFELAIRHMHPMNQALLYGLADCKGSTAFSKLAGIMNTNSLILGPLPAYNSAYAGIARDISRVNHR